MKLSAISSAILCTFAVTGLVSCGGGGGSDSSTGTSGSTVVGTIAGFGSIIMNNGVEYQTTGLANCEVDDDEAGGVCEDSLYTGMHVKLTTNANNEVTALKYDDELEGIATNVTGSNGDFSFEVFGVTVTTTNPETQWDDFTSNPLTAAELEGVSVEISGEWLADGTLAASYVEKQDDADDEHEVKGTVGVITGTTFPLTLNNGGIVNVDASAVTLPLEGNYVEVEGTYDAPSNTITATKIEAEDEDDFDDDSEAEITGTLNADTNSTTGYSIGNTDVDISNAPECAALVGTIVEAEGTFNMDSGVLLVEECEDEDENESMEVECDINNVTTDVATPKVGSVECDFSGTNGGPLTILFEDTPNLAMFSGDSTANPFDLSDISAGNCVEIKFSENANGDYVAGLIEREDTNSCDSYKLEGTVDSFNDGTNITVLGVTFNVSPGTTYDPSSTAVVEGAEVEIDDENADGTAEAVEVK